MTQPPSSFKVPTAIESPILASWRKRILEQLQLLGHVKKSLPDDLGSQVQHCLISGSQLVIYTHSSAWATRLRFSTDEILDYLNQYGDSHPQSIKIKVRPNLSAAYDKQTAKLPSLRAIEQLTQGLNQSGENDPLALSLQRLERTMKRRLGTKA